MFVITDVIVLAIMLVLDLISSVRRPGLGLRWVLMVVVASCVPLIVMVCQSRNYMMTVIVTVAMMVMIMVSVWASRFSVSSGGLLVIVRRISAMKLTISARWLLYHVWYVGIYTKRDFLVCSHFVLLLCVLMVGVGFPLMMVWDWIMPI